jgi:hypothetical protein
VAHFSTGTPFTLASADTKDGAITLDMALRAGTPMSYVALEGGVAAAKKTKRYNLRLAGRMMFSRGGRPRQRETRKQGSKHW